MSKIKNDRLDQYGTEHFEQQQFGTAGVEEVKCNSFLRVLSLLMIQCQLQLIKGRMYHRILQVKDVVCIVHILFNASQTVTVYCSF